MRLDPAASQLLIACLILLVALVLAVWNWIGAEHDRREAERELARTEADLDQALGWAEQHIQATAVVDMPAVEPRPLLQVIDGGET